MGRRLPTRFFLLALTLTVLSARLVAGQSTRPDMIGAAATVPVADEPEECSGSVSTASIGDKKSGPETLAASSETVHWGYTYSGLSPAATVSSGDEITVEMITHHAADDYDKMIKGDAGVEDIYGWGPDGQNVGTRGRTGQGDGVHILTGPIYVCGAEQGDVLQVDILDLRPRINPSTNKTYGSNAAANWGYQFRAGFLDGKPREVVTIYEILRDKDFDITWAVPDYQFQYGDYLGEGRPNENGYKGPNTYCVDSSGSFGDTGSNALSNWSSTGPFTFHQNTTVPCAAGRQQWGGLYYPGLITQHPTGTEDYSIRGKFKVPVNFHIGNMILAAATNYTVDSVPPSVFGGNLDNRRVGKGASMFYPVQVPGALLSMGDAHTAQGNSELDGTGIETSINGDFRLTLHKAGSLPKQLQGLNFPLLENDNEYVVQGFTYPDYLAEVDDPFSDIYQLSTLDRTMTVAYNQTRDFMMQAFNLTEDQAITAMTVIVDFEITQVVDGNWGIHAVIPKWPFSNSTDQYAPNVFPGSSKPAEVTMMTAL